MKLSILHFQIKKYYITETSCCLLIFVINDNELKLPVSDHTMKDSRVRKSFLLGNCYTETILNKQET